MINWEKVKFQIYNVCTEVFLGVLVMFSILACQKKTYVDINCDGSKQRRWEKRIKNHKYYFTTGILPMHSENTVAAKHNPVKSIKNLVQYL